MSEIKEKLRQLRLVYNAFWGNKNNEDDEDE